VPLPLDRARPSTALTLAVAAALCAGCEAELSSGLDEAQADEVVLALDEAGIGADRERADTAAGAAESATYRVVVARGDLAAALAVLREQELPRRSAAGFEELFDDTGLVPSAVQERARFAAAVGGELSRSIESIDGVTHARVHVALPEPGARMLDEGPAAARASVLIEHRPGADVDEAAVRALVAGAVQDLATDDVAVVLSETRAVPAREPHLARLGPVAVSRGTAGTLKAILAASFALNLILVVALVSIRRRTATRRAPAPPREPARPTEG
jgi:type III secretion protein J